MVLVRKLPQDDGVGERRLWQLHVRIAVRLPHADQAAVVPRVAEVLAPLHPLVQVLLLELDCTAQAAASLLGTASAWVSIPGKLNRGKTTSGAHAWREA